MILSLHLVILYFIGVFLAYGYIEINNKFESRRSRIGQKMGGTYRNYYIKKKNIFKSFYFVFELFVLKKY